MVPVLSVADRLPYRPSRVLVGGTSGSGKTTLAGRIALMIGASHTEIDSLHHGPGWTMRPEFIADVAALAGESTWVTEYQPRRLGRFCWPGPTWSYTCYSRGGW
jgi:energy-coupling factor transporter ATP-binding protein EcfA2